MLVEVGIPEEDFGALWHAVLVDGGPDCKTDHEDDVLTLVEMEKDTALLTSQSASKSL